MKKLCEDIGEINQKVLLEMMGEYVYVEIYYAVKDVIHKPKEGDVDSFEIILNDGQKYIVSIREK